LWPCKPLLCDMELVVEIVYKHPIPSGGFHQIGYLPFAIIKFIWLILLKKFPITFWWHLPYTRFLVLIINFNGWWQELEKIFGWECVLVNKNTFFSKLNISLGVRLVCDTTSNIVGKDRCSRTNVQTTPLVHFISTKSKVMILWLEKKN
jgi:hypothetical protein